MDDKVRSKLIHTFARLNLSKRTFGDVLSEYFAETLNSASTYHKYNGSIFDTVDNYNNYFNGSVINQIGGTDEKK